ncbi:MAG: hypothetical protein Q4C98_03735 [Capnocytophaga sp.]|nr:hypothetical protein [Capnocytophaga sp.]
MQTIKSNPKTNAIIYAKTQEIGKAMLSVGDFTMGGVVGEFYPNAFYSTHIQPLIWEFWDKDHQNQHSFFCDQLQLTVQLANGLFLLPLGGVWIVDFLSDEPYKHLEMSGVNTWVIENYLIENKALTLKNTWQIIDITEKKYLERTFRKTHYQNGFQSDNFSAIFKNANQQIVFEIQHERIEQSYCIVNQSDMTQINPIESIDKLNEI